MAHHARAVSANRLFALAAVLLTLVFVLMVSRVFDTPTHTAVRGEVVATPAYEAARTATTLDTDADGIPDWEETLLGTDLNDSDQNKNGVIDGNERDQLIKQPQASKLAYASSTTPPATLTDALAQELMGTYMEAIQKGKALDANVGDQILNAAFTTIEDGVTMPAISVSDLVVVENSAESKKEYVENMRAIIFEAGQNDPNEYAALADMVGRDRKKGIEMLLNASKLYEDAATSLKIVPVPHNAAVLHAEIITSTLQYATVLQNIALVEKDPVFAALYLDIFPESQLKILESMNSFVKYRNATNTADEMAANR